MTEEVKVDANVVGKKYGVVIPLGVDGMSDDTTIDTPSVILDGNTYKMWYSGYDGTNYRIHYATSEDGIVWDKYGVVVDLGTAGESDDSDVDTPCVIKDGSTYKMWYTGHDGSIERIHYATSEDGVVWNKHGVVVDKGSNGESDDHYVESPCVIKDGSTYKMWYTGHDGSIERIHYATSEDGVVWNKHGVVIYKGSNGMSEDKYIESPSVIYDGNTYKMWYNGYDGENDRLLYTTSTDGIKWDKHGIVINIETANENDSKHIYQPCVILDGNTYKMWYGIIDCSSRGIHYTELIEISSK